MATYLNRTLSMMSGDGPHNKGLINNVNDHRSSVRSTQIENSPLQIFVKAKKKINEIFGSIDQYVQDAASYVKDTKEHNLMDEEKISQIETYKKKVQGIRDVLARDHMKVAFFGRTSNGKSSVINAMLQEKILPSGIGHTTHCFLQVQGSPTDEPYLVLDNSDEHYPVESVGQLAHALCKEKLNESQCVKVFWPKSRCHLLRDDVCVVDSPGVDVSANLDEWIDMHCLDADVFVLVTNIESILSRAEKKFFHKVSTKLSNPNIFILNNRWDVSASEVETMDEVREQHQERAVEFLVNELKVCTMKEAEERIFFISAKEALLTRLAEQGRIVPTTLAEGFQMRYLEFQDFERKFEECISKSAVKTKFEQHTQRGRFIANELHDIFEKIYESTQKLKEEKLKESQHLHEAMEHIEKQLSQLTQEMKQNIHRMVEDVEQRVSKALNEEIKRLSNLVDEFNMPFHSEPMVLTIYKKELHLHVESGLGCNLRSRLSNALEMNIESSQREMTKKIEELIPTTEKGAYDAMLARGQPFQIFYGLNCDNLCADFREDLEFRFSWGLMTLFQKLMNSNWFSSTNTKDNSKSIGSSPTSPVEEVDGNALIYNNTRGEDLTNIARIALASTASHGTMGGLLVTGFLVKTVGWRIIVLTGVIYSSVYVYERLAWTSKAQERVFKRQYVNHATRKLRMIVDLTSANCSHQVQQELSSSYSKLCHKVDEAINKMHDKILELKEQLKELDRAANDAKVLKNKANFIINELGLFEEAYLKLIH